MSSGYRRCDRRRSAVVRWARSAEIISVVAVALPPPSGKKGAKEWISEPNSRRSTVTPAARIASA